jgi:hypothetical protein
MLFLLLDTSSHSSTHCYLFPCIIHHKGNTYVLSGYFVDCNISTDKENNNPQSMNIQDAHDVNQWLQCVDE